jgi:hypothetical protein
VEHAVSRGTIATILKPHGIDPAPERQKRTTWREFLRAHWSVLAAADFVTVEVWTGGRLTAVSSCSSLIWRRDASRSPASCLSRRRLDGPTR